MNFHLDRSRGKGQGKSFVPVSVVIPCYCCHATLERALTSVAAQSVLPCQVLLVEDASQDDGQTLRLLQHMVTAYAGLFEIKLIALKENGGAGSARNRGWEAATQPYVAFLDADDTWHPDKLRIQYEFMQSAPDVALCGHQCAWVRDGAIVPTIPKEMRVSRISARGLLFRNAFSTPSVMLRSDIPFRFQEGKRCAEDLLLWQQIAFSGLPVVRMESPLAYVHKPLYGAGGLSAQMWRMEMGELGNLTSLFKFGKIGVFLVVVAMSFSVAKFIRRLLVTRLKMIGKRDDN